ncbi:MAG TPA: hypothetical protein VGQ81_10415 [Acidobacteriota bacterium]|jgi:uncharacterized membrane protein|nr:hypothetical protein [Acidobacteriota bacterium]
MAENGGGGGSGGIYALLVVIVILIVAAVLFFAWQRGSGKKEIDINIKAPSSESQKK